MGSKLVDVGATLDVGSNDLRELRKQRRRDILTRIAQASAPIVSVILGILAAEAAYPVRTNLHDSYPYAPLLLSSLTTSHRVRKSWMGPIILSVALFIAAFAFVALFNTAASDNYGVTTKYGVFSASGYAQGMRV